MALSVGKARAFDLLDPTSWPFIPLPEVATDPNGGTTYGLLPVFLFYDHNHQINRMVAPDITNNGTLGVGGGIRFLDYPSADTQWYAIAGLQQQIARRVDLFYSTGRTRQKWWSFDARFFFERDPTERFFGIGNQSRNSNQTNFTTEQLYFRASLGFNLSPDLQLALVEKPRYVRITRGAFNFPFIGTLFPNLRHLDGGSEVVNQLMLSYDTRDAIEIPRAGGLARAFFAIADRAFLSSVSYTRFGGELRRYISFGDRFTLAAHAFLQYTPAGNETPFWSMARLGGEESLLTDQQTLRGYGAGRFIDNNLDVVNVELRTKVFEADIFQTHGILELAPFFEAGKVFHGFTDNPLNRLHPAGGVGFRAIADPFVVGYVDVGYASEGVSIFSGINYPF